MQKISVTIAVKGKENLVLLQSSLKSLASQKNLPFEIILVGDSKDIGNFRPVVPKGIAFKKIYANVDKNEARNLGIFCAKGDYILYLDHDMEASANLLSDCIKNSSTYDAIIIPEHGSGGNFWSNCRKLEKRLIKYDLDTVTPRFFKKNVFAKNEKPFDTKFGLLDEWGFNVKLKEKNASVGISDAFVIVTENNLSIRKEIVNKFKRGLWMKNFYLLDKEEAWRRINPVRRGFIFYTKHLDYFLKDPIHFVGLLVLKTIDLFAFLSGYMIAMLGLKERKVTQTYNNYGNIGEGYLKEMYTEGKWNKYVDFEEKIEVARLWKLNSSNLDDENILDLGMGPGRWSSFFIQYNFKNIIGLDISFEMVKFAKEKIKDKRFKAVLGNMERLNFEDNCFNKVFCFRALKYVPDYKIALREMSRVLKREGSFMLEVPNKSILNHFLRFLSIIMISIFPSLKGNSRWGYFSNVTFFSSKDILNSIEEVGNIKVTSINPFFILPSVRPPKLLDNYCAWILIYLNNILFKILPKEVFTRSWIVVGKKL